MAGVGPFSSEAGDGMSPTDDGDGDVDDSELCRKAFTVW